MHKNVHLKLENRSSAANKNHLRRSSATTEVLLLSAHLLLQISVGRGRELYLSVVCRRSFIKLWRIILSLYAAAYQYIYHCTC